MANQDKKKNKAFKTKNFDDSISFNDLIESRRQEMEHSILPGFYCVVRDPKHKAKDVKVYSLPYMKRTMFSVNTDT